jgi:hypothetical protein
VTATLEKALNYAKHKEHGGAIFKLRVDLGRCKELGHGDPIMKTWHRHGYDSAWSAAGLNGECEENCIKDPARIKITDVVLGDTSKASHAGYSVNDDSKLCFSDPDERRRQLQADKEMARQLERQERGRAQQVKPASVRGAPGMPPKIMVDKNTGKAYRTGQTLGKVRTQLGPPPIFALCSL